MKPTFLIAILAIILTALVFSGCNQPTTEKTAVTNTTKVAENTQPSAIKRTELTENAGYAMDLAIEPNAANANQDVALSFSVKDKDGKPFKNLKIVHEKLIHLLIVSEDLAFFEHVHPEVQTDGGFKLNYKFPTGGVYKLYADFTPENSPQIVNVFDVPVGGEKRAKTPLVADKELTKTVDGLTFTIKNADDFESRKRCDAQLFRQRCGRQSRYRFTALLGRDGAFCDYQRGHDEISARARDGRRKDRHERHGRTRRP